MINDSLGKVIFSLVIVSTAWCFSSPALAENIIEFGPFTANEFSPSRGETLSIPYILKEAAKVTVLIHTADNNLVRALPSAEVLPAGSHTTIWDGRDTEGIIVPDEAYTLVLRAKNEKAESVLDPRKFSGGEMEKNLQTSISADGTITFFLTKPSRVQVRAGITSGPMLRSLLNWVPRAAGKNILHWNGMDCDNVINLLEHADYGVSVTAFRLPEFSIITTGNTSLEYAQYFQGKKWEFTATPEDERLFERGPDGISPHYYYQRLADRDPSIDIHFPASLKKTDSGVAIVDPEKPTPIKVTMDAEDEQYIAETKYEVTFFIDNEFMSEEELGFMPITWLWKPNNLDHGKHILTVNVSGFKGQVGVKSTEFIIE